jgi:hypothetical protein
LFGCHAIVVEEDLGWWYGGYVCFGEKQSLFGDHARLGKVCGITHSRGSAAALFGLACRCRAQIDEDADPAETDESHANRSKQSNRGFVSIPVVH